MATMVHASQLFNQSFLFMTEDRHYIFVEDFYNGIASVVFTHDYFNKEEEFAEVISGCFDNNSNFRRALYVLYRCSYKTFFRGIFVKFADSQVLITKENSSKREVLEAIHKIIKEELDFLNDRALPLHWVSPCNVYLPSRHEYLWWSTLSV